MKPSEFLNERIDIDESLKIFPFFKEIDKRFIDRKEIKDKAKKLIKKGALATEDIYFNMGIEFLLKSLLGEEKWI